MTAHDGVGSDDWYGQEIDLVSELQAPLLGIAANARVANSKTNSGDSRVKQYLEAIEFSSQSLAKTVDILLRGRDLSNGSLELASEPLHIGLRVEEAIAKLEPLCRVQSQIFDFKPKKSLVVNANSECLELVIYHVLEQALRTAASEEIVSIDLSERKGEMAKMVVFAKGSRERASQLRASIKRSFEGRNSLGSVNFSLLASLKILKEMGGDFSVSQRRDGLGFILSFPISRQGELF